MIVTGTSKTNWKTSQQQSKCQLTLPCSIARLGWDVREVEDVAIALKIHFWLTFACEGGGEAWSPPSGLLLYVREVEEGAALHAREVEGGQHC